MHGGRESCGLVQYLIIRGTKMSYVTISNWTATEELTDEMIATANEKFVPMIMSVGASSVQMVRTGDLNMSVVTQYADAAAARR